MEGDATKTGLPAFTRQNTITGHDFVNLCPHEVVVLGKKNKWIKYLPEPTSARAVLDSRSVVGETDLGVKLNQAASWCKVEGIPNADANIIVSLVVAQVLVKLGTHRGMIMSPDMSPESAIRDPSGRVLACLALDWHNAQK